MKTKNDYPYYPGYNNCDTFYKDISEYLKSTITNLKNNNNNTKNCGPKFIEMIKDKNNLENKKMPAVILGNKIDISDRQVNENEAEEFTKSRNYKYFEVSAKSGKCVDESIKYLIKKVIEVADGDKKLHKSIKITNDDKDKNRHKTDKIKDCCNKK